MLLKRVLPNKYVTTYLRCVGMLLGLMLLQASCSRSDTHSDSFYEAFFKNQDAVAGLGKFDEAIISIDSLYTSTTNPSGYFRCRRYFFKSSVCYIRGKKDSTTIYLDSALKMISQYWLAAKHPLDYARILYARGDKYFTNNQIDSAFSYFSRSREIALPLDSTGTLIGQQAYHLGMISYRQEKYEDAAGYFKQAFASVIKRKSDSTSYYWLQEILSNTALAYTKLELYDSAIQYYSKALNFINTEGAKYSYSARQAKMSLAASGVTMGNLAKVYIATHKTDTAERLLLSSIAINSRPGYENKDVVAAYMQLAELYNQLGRNQEAIKLLFEMRPGLDTVKNLDVELRWRKLMCSYYLALHKPQEAETYMRSFLSLHDSLAKVQVNFKKIDYGMLLKQRDTHYEVILLKKDNELNRLYLLITISLVVVALTILLLIIANFRRSKKNVKDLTNLNNHINLQNGTLAKALKDLRTSNDDKDRILQVVAHDLRNPISVVVTIGSLLAEEETDEFKKKELGIIVKASSSVVTLSEELLEFSGRNGMDSSAEREVIDIREIATHVVTLLQFKAEEKQQKIKLQLPELSMPVLAFKEKINRVLNNLITNAIKFSYKNSEIDVAIAANEDVVLIKVRDYGVGMDPEQLGKIFDAFTSAKRRGTAGERSYGLGLSICSQIVELHRGKIWAESEPGKGSTFFVELPMANVRIN